MPHLILGGSTSEAITRVVLLVLRVDILVGMLRSQVGAVTPTLMASEIGGIEAIFVIPGIGKGLPSHLASM